ncbi:sugar-binding domain-containing protein [uncultured Draconibacterium sp.]|uniref:sugar-binding domain-containing protein n=1 Tax=uncultured Draconibacterium sp. TaxID=1573823 RepID=UPI002AA6CCAC|nr:sugar-binding domain-containing protein [uncultured Draconibacterium sp.]
MRMIYSILILFVAVVFAGCTKSPVKEISLAGEWSVKLDSMNIGMDDKWADKKLDGVSVQFPGTLDDAGLGKANTQKPVMDNSVMWGLTRKHQYIGKAWYQKEVNIPANWDGKNIELELERVIWQSQVFIDGKRFGKNESLTTPHSLDLSSSLTPGKHLLTVCIDNSNIYPLINAQSDKYPDPINQDLAHAYTNHTQIKWNGVIGDIKLTASEAGKVEDLQVYSNVAEGTIKATFKNPSDVENLNYQILTTAGEIVAEGVIEKGAEEITLQKPEGVELWNEFNPILYDFKVTAGDEITSARFGYSQIAKDDGVLTLNGKRIFLRGNLECVIFPLTGHPPMEKEEWAKLIAQAKAYGLNHLRFHSWCPPAAAFEAADEAGFFYQVELPHWSLHFGEDEKTTTFLLNEADRILSEYGNHPSFVLMALGNELEGDADLMNSTVAELRAKDNRHLYMTTSYSFQYPLGTIAQPEDDFFVTQKTDKGWIRGQGIFNEQYPNFNEDYTATSEHVPVPLISHEIGQYSVYPDMSEIEKYTGVLKPLNFMAVRNELEKNGLLDLAGKFTYASGKLAAILYKEEIERALKTPAFDGFQLLQLQDFPGQGTALVGLLNAFWESKGVISAEEFRQFNAEVVPLIRFEKAVYETGETFNASLEVANFFKEMNGQTLAWSITNKAGETVNSGTENNIDLELGNNGNLGNIEFKVDADKAEKLMIHLAVKGTEYKNNWPIWIYPKEAKVSSDNVVVTASLQQAKQELEKGNTVLLNPDYKKLKGIAGRFVPVFWSPVHFPNQPSSMGLLMDENHAAFNDFPTDEYTDWQWWDLCIKSKSLIVDGMDVTPIVRVIDNFVTNHHLTNVFETKVGEGKLVYSSVDLMNNLDERPVARQLRSSLLQYMESDEFNPSGLVTIDELDFADNTARKQFEATDIYND